MITLLAGLAMGATFAQGPAPFDSGLADALDLGGLTPSSARFDENLLRFYRTGEFMTSFYQACSENPWRMPFFAGAVREELAGQVGVPSHAIGSLSRLLGMAMRRTLLGNPNAAEEEVAKKPDALGVLLADWKNAGLLAGPAPELKGVPPAVQQGAALVLSVVRRSAEFRGLAVQGLGDLDAAYSALAKVQVEDQTGGPFEVQRLLFGKVDVGYLLAAGHDVLVAAQTAATLARAVAPDARYDVEFQTAWGAVRLTGGSDTRHADRPTLLSIDTGGDDVYVGAPATRSASNWASVVIDTFGKDSYVSDPALLQTPVNAFQGRKGADNTPGPGGALLGVSALIDLAGNDLYRTHRPGLGSGRLGVAALLDVAGDDRYDAYQDSEGFGMFGEGILEDQAGNDEYRGFLQVQGVGQTMGAGYLVDRAGGDTYLAEDEVIDFPSAQSAQHNTNMAQGAGNGRRGDYLDSHSLAGGVGILYDAAGDDHYSCALFGQGVGYWEGVGMLWDTGGSDRYDGMWYVQGASAHFAIGYLEDTAGDDAYNAPMNMAQGAGHDFSVGWLLDRAGNDTHKAPNLSLGAGNANGIGIFADLAGDDRYESSGITLGKAAESPATGIRSRCPCLGVFLDLGGNDTYPAATDWAKDGAQAANWSTKGPTAAESALGVFWDR